MAEIKLRDIKYFQSKYVKLTGSSYDEVYARARKMYDQIKAKSKRQPCALDLLQHSRLAPVEKRNPNGNHERVFRFYGRTKGGEEFWVQVKEDKKTKGKYLMSIVPPKQKN
ncbi:MAG: hypothetical protein LBN12_06440 [Clostridiales Family XIII bacterium]|jgi:hypothetical protein|nr:hypothetical protein [Clostridiales Family XIII bacterium]